MDLNLQYAEHQRALMVADRAANQDDRLAKLDKASRIAGRIRDFQYGLGAAAACAWSNAQFANAAAKKSGSNAKL
jgi:hypothetical protein